MNSIFWTIVAVDAALFTALLVNLLMQGGGADGGREMGIFFFVIVPVLVLGLAVLLFVFSSSSFWKVLALLIVTGPGLFLAGGQIRGAYIDYVVRQNALGRGYFSGSILKAMGAAVVQGDTAALQRLGPTVDINTVTERGMTLIGLAAEEASNAKTPERVLVELSVVETLLKLGAKPDPALDTAIKLDDPAILQALLLAGADPNRRTATRGPVVFNWLSVMPAANLLLLIEHGLNVNVVEYNSPLVLETAFKRRWDLVVLLAEHGADLRVPRTDGRTVAEEVTNRLAEARSEGREPAPELLQVQSLLDAQPVTGKAS